MSIRQALIIPDCHIPYHDERAYQLMLTVAQDLPALEEIVILGDFADFYAINNWGKDPDIKETLMDEIFAVNEKLDELDRLFPDAKKVYIEGNHEFRLIRYLQSKAPDLFGILDWTSMLRLGGRKNWEYVAYGPSQLYQVAGSKLYARHEPLGGATHAAYSSVVKAGCSLVFGHIHRIQESQVVMIDGQNHRGISVGWLGDKTSPVVQYVKQHHQWALGFGIANIIEDGTFFHQTSHIIDYKCNYGDYIYEG